MRCPTAAGNSSRIARWMLSAWRAAISSPMARRFVFNLKGEPIVNTPANALQTFSKSEMDALVLEDFLIEKKAP